MIEVFVKSLRYRWLEYVLGIAVVAVLTAILTVQRSLSAHQEQQVHERYPYWGLRSINRQVPSS
jgi:hypothetical protein